MPLTPQEFVSKWKQVGYVFASYGWTSELSDDEILERLLALNLERVEG
jgi:hypothetical protein